MRFTAVIIVALLLALLLLDVVQAASPASDCYDTYLPSYSENIQPGVKENWAEHSRLSQGVCRIDGRPPRQNECKFTFQLGVPEGAFGKGAENSWLCWYGDPK